MSRTSKRGGTTFSTIHWTPLARARSIWFVHVSCCSGSLASRRRQYSAWSNACDREDGCSMRMQTGEQLLLWTRLIRSPPATTARIGLANGGPSGDMTQCLEGSYRCYLNGAVYKIFVMK